MNPNLTEEENHMLKLEKAGFTQDQLDALDSWMEFNKKQTCDYIIEIEIDEVKKNLEGDLRHHRHLENGEVTRPY